MSANYTLNMSELSFWRNVTDEDSYKHYILDMIYMILFFFLILPVVAGNVLVLVAIKTDSRLHSATHVLIASLAIADLVVGIVTLPTFTLVHHTGMGWDKIKSVCLMSYIFSHCPTAVSSMTLLIISIERFIAIHFPFQYQKWFTSRMMVSGCVCVWLYVWISIPTLMYTDNHWNNGNEAICNFADVSSTNYRAVLLGHMIGVLFVTTVLHSIVGYTAWKHRRRIAQQINIIRADIKIQRDAKTARMLAMVLGIFYICWVPYLLTIPFTSGYRGQDPFWLHTWEQIGGIIVICNSFLNPVVYAWQNKTFRRAFQKILCNKKYRTKPSFLHRTGRLKTLVTKVNTSNRTPTMEDLVGKDSLRRNNGVYGSNDTLDDSESYGMTIFKNKHLVSSQEFLANLKVNPNG